MISTVTNQGKVRWMIYPGKMNAALFIVFLTRLITGAEKEGVAHPGLQCVESGGRAYQSRPKARENQGLLRCSAG